MDIDTMPILSVEWIDSLITDMTPVDEAEDATLACAVITSVGYVVRETDDMIVLAREHVAQTRRWRGVVCIPKVAIRSRRTVSPTTEPAQSLVRICAECGHVSEGTTLWQTIDRANDHVNEFHAGFSFRQST